MDSINWLSNMFSRERGISKFINYDFALGRLRVAYEDSWLGIAPTNVLPGYNPHSPLFAAKFADCDGYRHILAIANEDGQIALQDTTKRNELPYEQPISAFEFNVNVVFDIEWVKNKMLFISASGDHTARLWSVTNSSVRSITTYVGHTRSVKTIACPPDNDVMFASGARDGSIIIWDIRSPAQQMVYNDNCLVGVHGLSPISGHGKRRHVPNQLYSSASSTVTSLIFQDENTLISCGASDGIIKVWDLRRNYAMHKKEPQPKYSIPYAGSSTLKGYTNLIADKCRLRLYASCMDGYIYAFNLNSYNKIPLSRYKGALISTFYVKSCMSPDDKYLVSGSTDGRAYIWNVDYPGEPLVRLNGHAVEVTCVAWSSSHDQPLVTCSDDASHKIWRITPEDKIENNPLEKYSGYANFVRNFTVKPKNPCQKNDKKESINIVSPNVQSVSSVKTIKRNINDIVENSKNDDNNPNDNDISNTPKKIKVAVEKDKHVESTNSNVSDDDLPSTSSKCKISSIGNINQSEDLGLMREDNGKNKLLLSSNLFNSPTANLPNYVLTGEAPHLSLMSPKRQSQEVKIDWLTKIRQQKLKNSNIYNTKEKSINPQPQNNQNTSGIIDTSNTSNTISMHLESNSLRLVDDPCQLSCQNVILQPNNAATKRALGSLQTFVKDGADTGRNNGAGINGSVGSHGGGINSNRSMLPSTSGQIPRNKVRTTTRPNNEPTLLSFFTTQKSNSNSINKRQDENQENLPGNDQYNTILSATSNSTPNCKDKNM